MPVEIRKLVIRGIVNHRSQPQSTSNGRTIVPKQVRIDHEKERIKLVKFRRDILRECKEMVNEIIERKSNRY